MELVGLFLERLEYSEGLVTLPERDAACLSIPDFTMSSNEVGSIVIGAWLTLCPDADRRWRMVTACACVEENCCEIAKEVARCGPRSFNDCVRLCGYGTAELKTDKIAIGAFLSMSTVLLR